MYQLTISPRTHGRGFHRLHEERLSMLTFATCIHFVRSKYVCITTSSRRTAAGSLVASFGPGSFVSMELETSRCAEHARCIFGLLGGHMITIHSEWQELHVDDVCGFKPGNFFQCISNTAGLLMHALTNQQEADYN